MGEVLSDAGADMAWRALREAVACGCGIAQPSRQPEGTDWTRFAVLVDRHRVGAVIHRSGWALEVGAPGEVLELLHADAYQAALDGLRLLALQRDALGALSEAGIPAVVLKGTALAQHAYGAVAARDPGDLDVLVCPGDVTPAVNALLASGFDWHGLDLPAAMRPPDGGLAALGHADALPLVKEAILERSRERLDIHWRLTENSALMPVAPGWIQEPRVVDAGGVPTPVLPALPAWWYLLVHGAHHSWMRLKWLADVPAVALRDPDLFTSDALEATRRAGLGRCVAAGLLTAERVLGPFMAPEVRDWATRVHGTRRLVRAALQALESESVDPEPLSPARLASHFATRMSFRADWAYRSTEARRLLLEAGRRQLEPDPGLRALASGPARWLGRSARRARQESPSFDARR